MDFSCALFGPDGGLVANAPHIPVHLGAMQKAVQYQMEALGNDIHEGDVIMSNHPAAGGSHLPDITVITPVSVENGNGTGCNWELEWYLEEKWKFGVRMTVFTYVMS